MLLQKNPKSDTDSFWFDWLLVGYMCKQENVYECFSKIIKCNFRKFDNYVDFYQSRNFYSKLLLLEIQFSFNELRHWSCSSSSSSSSCSISKRTFWNAGSGALVTTQHAATALKTSRVPYRARSRRRARYVREPVIVHRVQPRNDRLIQLASGRTISDNCD